MRAIFVIGLVKSLRARFEGKCKQLGIAYRYILADIGQEGTYDILPIGQDPIHAFHAFADQIEPQDGLVIVLPYAGLSNNLQLDLQAFESMGGQVLFEPPETKWPTAKKRKPLDQASLNALLDILILCISPESFQEAKISEYYTQAMEGNAQLIITKDALMQCDEVSVHRRDFMIKAIDALGEFACSENNGRIDAFFNERGIEHAQTGGITTTLSIRKNGKEIYGKSSNTHLKQGDKTTREAAARIYYQIFFIERIRYIAVLYAGPHPDKDINYVHELGDEHSLVL